MFFIMGISNGRKDINYDSGGMNICKSCGAYGCVFQEAQSMLGLRGSCGLIVPRCRARPDYTLSDARKRTI